MKRILIVTNHFYPETFRCNDIAFELASRGFDVSVLTGIPDYPQGKFHTGYGVFKKRTEKVRGVKVYRSFLIPRGDGGKFRLMLNYLSSYVCMTLRALWLAIAHRYDAVLVHETSPVMIGTPAKLVSKLQRIPMYFWVLDLWPESLRAAGGINNPKILGFFSWMTKRYYRASKKILMSSQGFEQSICQMGDFKDKLVYFPNWSDKDMATAALKPVEGIPDGFVVMFAGNVGEAQDFDNIGKAALKLEGKDIHFVIVGDGRKMPWLKAFVEEHDLASTVHLMGRHPVEMMPSFFDKADAMLVTLKDEEIFNLTLPAKIQAYMAAGKPVVAMMNGEGPRIIDDAACGLHVPAGDGDALADAIEALAKLPRERLDQMGNNALAYCQEHFSYDSCMNDIVNLILT